jgi:hypothetical protein
MPVPEPIVPAESSVPGTVVSLTLGETGEIEMDEPEVPTLDVPEEFAMPSRGPVGERDEDMDIEEID